MTDQMHPKRESIEYDVVIVGAGPAGLSAAIRLKQIEPDLSVVVLEKGSEVGAHILSGAVLDPIGLDRLIPEWREKGAPVKTAVVDDNFYVLGETGQVRVPSWPMPRLMNNHGNYIVSMGSVCRWLAGQAEKLGVEIFPGMAASQVVWDGDRVKGVVAGEMGLQSDNTPGPHYEPGMELHGKYVFIGEGVRGSLAKEIINRLNLSKGVYAVFEAKQTVDARLVAYAQEKVASVRRLHRTSLPIPYAKGVYPAKPLIPILGGLLTFESEWSPALGTSFEKALSANVGDGRLDIGCVASHGHFSYDQAATRFSFVEENKPATAFLFKLISQLQFSGTVPMIDVEAYGKWLTK